jgi:hypothetical protein
VGYAGFFALWTLVKAELTPQLHAWAALLVGLSLVFFVGWEVIKMAATTLQIRHLEERLAADNFSPRQASADMKSGGSQIDRYWGLAFALAIVPALLGAGALFYGIGRNLVRVM